MSQMRAILRRESNEGYIRRKSNVKLRRETNEGYIAS